MEKKEYRFQLEKYSGSRSKHTCPQCHKRGVFVRYIDTETYNYISNEVGRCDRQSECGYNCPPRKYFNKNGYFPESFKKYKTASDVPFRAKLRLRMDSVVMTGTFNKSEDNKLVKFLMTQFDPEQVDEAILNYNVGTINKWPGSTVFWQVDKNNEIRTGKIIQYDERTGKRVKEPYSRIAWMHTPYLQLDFAIKQCLFGEHLLAKNTDKIVGVVESEKTAIIASLVCPELIWVAVGSANNLNDKFCEPLKDREVILYPDTDAYVLWTEKSKSLTGMKSLKVSDDLQSDVEYVKNHRGADLADYFLYLQAQVRITL